MKIHEYQAKELFRAYGIPVPIGRPALSIEEAHRAVDEVAKESKKDVLVVKAQIHAGGRGKGGGVKVCKGAPAAHEAVGQVFGMQLVTKQTGPEGQKVRRLLVEEGLDIAREIYLAFVVDRDRRRLAIVASAEGGTEIEELARERPEAIVRESVDPALGLPAFQARNVAFGLGLRKKEALGAARLISSMYRLCTTEDCSLVEVNPLVVTKQGEVVALDGKINFDDNGDFRHPGWEALRDPDEEDPTEREAKAAGLSYVSLKGNIGCLVNGAGLAMSTMDIIKHCGGEPANFLDVGGGATGKAVTTAMSIILRDPDVKGIFVNIFGGIMKCDVIAEGVMAATRELGLKVPLVVRLQGTNVEKGRSMLAQSGLQIAPADSMLDGARKIVELVHRKGN
ncbi:MAG: ADP-forming succinate--CoA ligase subunit beta [Deltaproteobacteria bacterium]|nr:ADP-forming succinate--CoA ligase subunit beta [Deltaproteobacteria bacterium]